MALHVFESQDFGSLTGSVQETGRVAVWVYLYRLNGRYSPVGERKDIDLCRDTSPDISGLRGVGRGFDHWSQYLILGLGSGARLCHSHGFHRRSRGIRVLGIRALEDLRGHRRGGIRSFGQGHHRCEGMFKPTAHWGKSLAR